MLCVCFLCVGYDATAESREYVFFLKQREISLSILQILRQKSKFTTEVSNFSESWIDQKFCNEGHETCWRLCRLPSEIVSREQVFVPFAEPAKIVLSVAPTNVGKEAVETNAITRRVAFLQCHPKTQWSMSKTTPLQITFCSPH